MTRFLGPKSGEPELYYAARHGDIDRIKELIRNGNLNINELDAFGRNAMHIASANGRLEVIKTLTEEGGAALDIPCSAEDRIPLHIAAASGHVECAQYLCEYMIAHKVDVNVGDRRGNTALHLAATQSDLVVEAIVAYTFPSIALKNKDGKTPIQLATLAQTLTVSTIVNHVNKLSSNNSFNARKSMRHVLRDLPINVLQRCMGLFLSAADIVRLDTAWSNKLTRPKLFQAYRHLNSLSLESLPHHELNSLKWISRRQISIQKFNLNHIEPMLPLHWACQHNAAEVLELLCRNGNYDINAKCNSLCGNTALHIACAQGSGILFQTIISNYLFQDIDFNVQNHEGRTPLHVAVFRGSLEMVKRLVLEFQCKLNIADTGGMTALQVAIWKGHIGICHVILSCACCTVNLKTTAVKHEESKSDLQMKKKAKREEVYVSSLNPRQYAEPVDIDLQDAQGWSAVHYACFYNSLNVLKLLLQLNGNTQLRETQSGQTALYMACMLNSIPQVQVLLSVPNPPVNTPAFNGSTPLHIACQNGNDQMVQILLHAAALITLQDQMGNTAFHIACENGYERIVHSFLANIPTKDIIKPLLQTKNYAGLTPMHAACCNSHYEVIESLLATGYSDIDSTDCMGWTALFRAVISKRIDIVQLLIQHGAATISLIDPVGWSPISIAIAQSQGLPNAISDYLEHQQLVQKRNQRFLSQPRHQNVNFETISDDSNTINKASISSCHDEHKKEQQISNTEKRTLNNRELQRVWRWQQPDMC